MANSLIKALAIASVAAGLSCAEDCTEDEMPRFDDDPIRVEMEVLEERVIDLTNVLRSEGCCVELSIDSDPYPFRVEQLLDGEGRKLRIFAPSGALINSDYLTYKTVKLSARNPCGEADTELLLIMDYGCEEIENLFDSPGGTYHGKVISSRYIQRTGIFLEPGSTARISADGLVCWSMFSDCEGPAQTPTTWGLWAKVGERYVHVGEGVDIVNEGSEAEEIKFMIPDSDRPTGTIEEGDEAYCINNHYRDNSNAFDVVVEFIWPDTP
jgi:hypothetical protein